MPADDATVTTETVEGEVDYDRLREEFGAEELTDDQRARFPDHPMVRRGHFFAGRDLDRWLDAAAAGEPHSIVTGIGPSGPMHLGHALVFYVAKHLQEQTGARVLVPLSDDEKYWARDQTVGETHAHLRANLRDLVAVGFDPDLTHFVIDTADADAIYPHAVRFAKGYTPATVAATYGEQLNVGMQFYPAVQATHLVLPQLLDGPHPTLVPVAVDQDPHVRLARDVAAKERFDVEKPGALLGKFLPSLAGPGKMSASEDAPTVDLDDDPGTVHETIAEHAYSGGRADVADHREHGGDPEVDVAFQYLRAFFEPDDDALAEVARSYRAGELLSGELKARAADRIAEFLVAHQARKPAPEDLADALDPYRLGEAERARLRTVVP